MRKMMRYQLWIVLLAFGLTLTFVEFGRAASRIRMGKGRYAGMVLIPAGPFTMGRNDGPPEEKPAHHVFLPAYYIDRNLVTWADYLPFIQEKGPEGAKGEMYLDTDDPDAKIIPKGDAWVVEKGFEKLPASEMAWAGPWPTATGRKRSCPARRNGKNRRAEAMAASTPGETRSHRRNTSLWGISGARRRLWAATPRVRVHTG